MRRSPRLAEWLVVVAGGAASLATPVAAAPSPVRGWTITRTAPGTGVLEGELQAAAGSSEATIAMFALKGSGRDRRIDYRFVTSVLEWGVDGWARVHGPGVPRVDCAAACEDPVGIAGHLYVSSNGHAISSTVYVAAWSVRDVTIRIDSAGWTVRPWRPAMRVLTGADAGGAGVSAVHDTVGTYTGGSLPGGRYGSFVFATLPCDTWGQGTGALAGYLRPLQMSCPLQTVAVSGAPGATTWRVTADVTGTGSRPVLVAVVDWPKN